MGEESLVLSYRTSRPNSVVLPIASIARDLALVQIRDAYEVQQEKRKDGGTRIALDAKRYQTFLDSFRVFTIYRPPTHLERWPRESVRLPFPCERSRSALWTRSERPLASTRC